MTYSIADGSSIHDAGPVGLGVLQDVGWTMTAPATPTPNRRRPRATPTATPRARAGRQHPEGGHPWPALYAGRPHHLHPERGERGQPAGQRRPRYRHPARLPAGPISYASNLVHHQPGGANYAWTVAPLAAGASGVISVYARIDPSLPITAVVVNTAQISDPQDRDPSNNSSTAYAGRFTVYLPLVVRSYSSSADTQRPRRRPRQLATATPTAPPGDGIASRSRRLFGGACGKWRLDNGSFASGDGYRLGHARTSTATNSGGNYAFSRAFASLLAGRGTTCGSSTATTDRGCSWMARRHSDLTWGHRCWRDLQSVAQQRNCYAQLRWRFHRLRQSTSMGRAPATPSAAGRARSQCQPPELVVTYGTLANLLWPAHVWVAAHFQSDRLVSPWIAPRAAYGRIVLYRNVTVPALAAARAGGGAAWRASGPVSAHRRRQP